MKRIAAASPARSSPARIRNIKEAGVVGMGPGGLFGGTGGPSTPATVNLEGGPPPRAEDAYGSGSCSYSVNSYPTTEKWYCVAAYRLEQPEDGFDGDPGGHRAVRRVPCRHKFPASNGLRGAIIEAQTNSFDNVDLRGAPVGADQHLQRHGTL